MDYPEVMTPEQVAQFLSVSIQHVQALARKRILPARKVGHLWRFDRDRVREWMRSGVSSSPEEKQ